MGLYGNTCQGILHPSANGGGSQKGPRCFEIFLSVSQKQREEGQHAIRVALLLILRS